MKTEIAALKREYAVPQIALVAGAAILLVTGLVAGSTVAYRNTNPNGKLYGRDVSGAARPEQGQGLAGAGEMLSNVTVVSAAAGVAEGLRERRRMGLGIVGLVLGVMVVLILEVMA